MAHTYNVDLHVCEETGVLTATGPHIPGLVLEADTIGGIMDALLAVAPRLIETNLKMSLNAGDCFDLRFDPSSAPPASLSMNAEMPMLARAA